MSGTTAEIKRLVNTCDVVVRRWINWSTGASQARTAELRTLLASVISTRDRIGQLDYDESNPEVVRLLNDLRAAYSYIHTLPMSDENLDSFLAHGAEVVTLGQRLIDLGRPLPPLTIEPGGRTLHEPEEHPGPLPPPALSQGRGGTLHEPEEGAAPHKPEEHPAPILSDMSSIIEEEIKKLSPGRIVFNPPTDMWLGGTERVEVRISRTLTDDLAAGLKGRGVPRVETIKVGTFMKVQLEGAAFQIEPLTGAEQPIPATGFTEWSWNVKPLESGVQVLSLAVAVRIKLPDRGEETYYSPVLDRRIHVKVNLVRATVGFVKGNWQWIVGTLVGSGALWHFLGPKSK